jgi:hypothetical protein
MQTSAPLRALLIAGSTALSCGGQPTAPVTAPPTPSAAVPAAGAEPDKATVYDAAGRPHVCGKQRPVCPEVERDTAFLDRCRLGGFQVRVCGCSELCSGDVSAAGRGYDPAGNAKVCEPARTDCEVAPARAAFQDACAERGFRLSQCGCEWLCSGKVDVSAQ